MKWVHDGNGEVTTEEYEVNGQKVVDLICNCEVVNGVSVNAQLIASAPDLLEALQLAFAEMTGGMKSCGHNGYTCTCSYEKARAAISKALGEE